MQNKELRRHRDKIAAESATNNTENTNQIIYLFDLPNRPIRLGYGGVNHFNSWASVVCRMQRIEFALRKDNPLLPVIK